MTLKLGCIADDYTGASDLAKQAINVLTTDRVKSRAIALAEVAITEALIGDYTRCLDHGSAAATLCRELEVSTATDILHEINIELNDADSVEAHVHTFEIAQGPDEETGAHKQHQ